MGTIAVTVTVVLLISLIVAMIVDSDAREAVVTTLWAMIVGPILLSWMGAVALLRLLPPPIRPRRIRGRALSVRALQRVADKAQHDGWMVSGRFASIVVLRRKKV
jgi:hypothetical protein